jgi:branched-chain amino acid transport system substrate-binding protein
MLKAKDAKRPGVNSHARQVRMRTSRRLLAIGVVVSIVAAACSSSSDTTSGSGANNASAPGVTATSVKVGYLSSLTGALAAGFTTTLTGFKARIAMQNAEGGVNGRKINVVYGDDQGSPSGNVTAAQTLVEQDNVFAIGAFGAFTFASEPYLLKQGVPVVGGPIDGPEWSPPDNNMFPVDGSANKAAPAAVEEGKFFKARGVTKIALVTSPIPSAQEFLKNVAASAKAVGIQVVYENLTIPDTQEGGFQNIVQQIKADKANGVMIVLLTEAEFAMLDELEQAGVHATMQFSNQPPGSTLATAQAQAEAQGIWADIPFVPAELSSPATATMQAALAKYAKQTTPADENEEYGWMTADLLIQGLKLAGRNPTRASFTTKLRADNDYTAGGLNISPVSFTASFAAGAQGAGPAPKDCAYFIQYKGTSWVASKQPICGGLVPNSNANG